MILFRQQQNGKLLQLAKSELDAKARTWIDVRQVNREDIHLLTSEYGIDEDHILDILDPDELSRIEKEDNYTLIIMRIPLFSASDDVSYFTSPLGIIIFDKTIVTLCWTECELLRDFAENRLRGLSLDDFPAFIIRILSRSDTAFLRYLKEINRLSTAIQNELQRSVQNDELLKLLNLEKSLVFFTTSLKSNQLLLEKLAKTRLFTFDADDKEWLEDVEIDNRQAIEMADTYSDIMSGMMDAFASVISNNLNIIMKKLTIISLVLMVPTFIVSFFGMNIPLPFTEAGKTGFIVVSLICLGTATAAHFMLTADTKHKKRERRARKRG